MYSFTSDLQYNAHSRKNDDYYQPYSFDSSVVTVF